MAENTQMAELDGGPVTLRMSLYLQLEEGLKKSPHEPAIIVTNQPSDHLAELLPSHMNSDGTTADCLSWTYTQLHHAALQLAVGLTARGVQPGAMVMTFMPNGVEYAVLVWTAAILKLGLGCLDPGALSEARGMELENYMQSLKPHVVVAVHAEGAEAVEHALLATGVTSLQVKVRLDYHANAGPGDWITLPALASEAAKHGVDEAAILDFARADDNPDRLAFLLFTSGTSSGKPKGCPRHVASVIHVLETSSWKPEPESVTGSYGRFLLTTPNYRMIAQVLSLAHWKAGGTAVMLAPAQSGGFNATGCLDAIEQYGVTTLIGIPMMLHLLFADPSFSVHNLSSLRLVLVGAEIITKGLFGKATEAFPHARVVIQHGMTEIGALVTWPFHDKSVDDIPFFGDICPIGVPVPGVRLRICDAETTATIKRGELGELCFSGDAVIKHYLDNVNESLFFIDDSGRRWFRTGDLGMVSHESIMFILGRIKDIIKRGGLGITPAALETCLANFAETDACVLPVPHPELGQEPFAVVRERNGKTDEGIKHRVVETFGSDYALAGVASLDELGLTDFPLNATAKIQKFDLQERVVELIRKRRSGCVGGPSMA